ncbi:MAG: signal recognition particle-docking protein FtsY [Pseudomonadota bacterium]|nr:signal recognition particle-docking protein FtsY [Pseudomonadota bacterium]
MMSEKKPGFFKRLLGSLMGSRGGDAPAAEEVKPLAAPEQTPSPAPAPGSEKRPAPPKKQTPEPKKTKSPARKATAVAAPVVEAKPAAEAKPKAQGTKTQKPKASPGSKAAPKPKASPKAAAAKPATAAPKQAPVPEPTPSPRQVASPPAAAAANELPPPASKTGDAPRTPEPGKKGWFSRLRDGLSKTSGALTENITGIFTKRRLDAATLQELEDALIQADLGVDMAMRIAAEVGKGRFDKEIAPEEVRAILGSEVAAVLEGVALPLDVDPANRPQVILVVGVNGTGKTTTIGKLANRFRNEGKRVVLAAGDTFRAAAIDQLRIWGERTGSPVVASSVGGDAASLAFDALSRAREEDADVLLIDTAGRLQNKADLMAELAKIVRVIRKIDETAPHSVLLVLDATTGQNAIRQVEVFSEIAGVTGLIMTKLDGTARGGILVAIAERFSLPVHAIGVGEGVDDLQPFDAYEFAALIAGAREKVDA